MVDVTSSDHSNVKCGRHLYGDLHNVDFIVFLFGCSYWHSSVNVQHSDLWPLPGNDLQSCYTGIAYLDHSICIRRSVSSRAFSTAGGDDQPCSDDTCSRRYIPGDWFVSLELWRTKI